MTALEEERRQKEENELQEIHELIHLEENYFKLRDFSGKGRTVIPSGKQKSILEKVAKTIRFSSSSTSSSSSSSSSRKSLSNNSSSSQENEDLPEDIHLVNNKIPRIYIGSIQVTSKTESEKSFIRRSVKKTLFLFNDVLLITVKKDSSEYFDVTNVIWLHHLRLSHSAFFNLPSSITNGSGASFSTNNNSNINDEEKYSFDLIISSSNRKSLSSSSNPFIRSTRTVFTTHTFLCDNEAAFVQWIGELEDTILAYHRQTESSRIIGWFYDYIRGSFHSAAYLGDIQLVKKYIKSIEATIQNQNPNLNSSHISQRIFSSSSIGSLYSVNTTPGQIKASINTLDKYLEFTRGQLHNLDSKDLLGMNALHWSSLRGHEGITRLLLQHGAEVDAIQAGGNTPLLLSVCSLSCAVTGIFDGRLNTTSEISTPRILLDRGADINCKNNYNLDVVSMAVLSSHSSKALPWILQMLSSRGADCSGEAGSTALHLCAQRNLARAVRLLVDSGVDVNFLMAPPVLQYHSLYNFHANSSGPGSSSHPVTPLLLACAHPRPDVETIRSFLDNGAFPNIRDAQGKTALLLILDGAPDSISTGGNNTEKLSKKNSFALNNNPSTPVNKKKLSLESPAGSASFSTSPYPTPTNLNADFEGISTNNENYSDSDSGDDAKGPSPVLSPSPASKSFSFKDTSTSTPSSNQKWRAMENTLHLVGDWAALTLPLVLELCKRGARIDNFIPSIPNIKKVLDKLRPSFRAAIMEAIEVWEKKMMPSNFLEFVLAKEQAGEDLKLHKGNWKRDKESGRCQLCFGTFSLTFRRHHCRACGVIVCDYCSSKRLILSSSSVTPKAMSIINSYNNGSRPNSPAPTPTSASSSTSANSNASLTQILLKEEPNVMERVCDGCFNRLIFESSQPSADHYRARQLRQCALEVLRSVQELITSLDSSTSTPSLLNETLKLNQELENLSLDFSSTTTSSPMSTLSLTPSSSQSRLQSSQALVETLKQREMKLFNCENVLSKFLEVFFLYIFIYFLSLFLFLFFSFILVR